MNNLHLLHCKNPINGNHSVTLYINDKSIAEMFRYRYYTKVCYSDRLLDHLLFDLYPFLEMFRSYKQFRKSLIYLVSDV